MKTSEEDHMNKIRTDEARAEAMHLGGGTNISITLAPLVHAVAWFSHPNCVNELGQNKLKRR